MLRVRVEPGLVRRLRAAGGGRPLRELANEALRGYLADLEAGAAMDANAPRATNPNGSSADATVSTRPTPTSRGGEA